MADLNAALVPKRTEVAGRAPTAAQLQVGEIATNLTDRKLYSKRSNGTVIALGGVGITASAATPSGSSEDNYALHLQAPPGEAGSYAYSQTSLQLQPQGPNNSTTFTDQSTFAHALTRFGNTVQTTAQVKYAPASIYFDGSGDYLQAEDSTAFNLSGTDAEISIFFRPEGPTISGFQILIYKGTYGSNESWYVGFDSSGVQVGTANGGSNYFRGTVTGGVTADTWHHVALTNKPGSGMRLWFDGVQVGTTTLNLTNAGSKVVVGCGTYNNPQLYFKGWIGALRVTKLLTIDHTASAYTIPAAQWSTTAYTAPAGSARLWLWSTAGNQWIEVYARQYISKLEDTAVATPAQGDLLRYNGTAWANLSTTSILGGQSINALLDVDTTSGLALGVSLVWNGTTWTPQAVGTALSGMNDVQLAGLATGQFLRYDAATSKWKNQGLTASTPTNGQVPAWSTSTASWVNYTPVVTLNDLSNVQISGTPTAGQVLAFSGSAAGKWQPQSFSLSLLSDVADSLNPTSGQLLTYNPSQGWVAADPPAPPNQIDLSTESINALGDVDTATAVPSEGQALVYNSLLQKWVPGNVASGGGGGGGGLATGFRVLLDDVSSQFNGTATTFALLYQGVAIQPGAAENLQVVRNGVLQEPGEDYTVSGSYVSLTTAPANGVEVFLLATLYRAAPVGLADLADVSATTAQAGQALVWTGSAWAPGAATGSGLKRMLDDISGQFNGTQTAFLLKLGGQLYYAVSAVYLEVYVGGARQTPGSGYTINGPTLTFSSAPAAGLECLIIATEAAASSGTPGTVERIRRHSYQEPYSYNGTANTGTAETAPDWVLTRVQVLSSGEVVTQYAIGSWTGRAAASYSLAPLLAAPAPSEGRRFAYEGGYSYIGVNLTTSDPAAASWTLTRIQVLADGEAVALTATSSWNNRAAATYS